uniref:Reverse transcriptase domain-containing protein n=1 Tax=Tanacetum cinerariifolium TaxID=118510 RepID=A0A6L2MLE2_TANCI|nr:hypothetical protein [Tanacetum cinerariifolium]
MDSNSILRKICLGEEVIVISSDKVEGSRDWNSLAFQDTANSGQNKAMVFYQMDTEEVSDRFVAPCFVNGLEAYDGEINLGLEENMISNEYAVKLCLEHEVKRGNKVVKKELNIALKVWKDKLELDGKIIKEEKDAIKRIKGEALKEKDDPGAFIFPIKLEGQVNENALADTRSDINTMPYRIYETLGGEDMKKVDIGITMINHTQAEAIGILPNVLCRVGVTTLIGKFVILDISIDRDSMIVVGQGFLCTIGAIVNTPERLFSTFDGFCHQTFRAARSDFMRKAKSNSDDEEYYQIKRNKFRAPIYGPKPAPYLNYNDPDERSLALQTVTNPLQKISVWKKATTRYDKIQKNDLWLLSMFDARNQNGVLTEDVVRSLSASIYCRGLDTITLRDLIDYDGKLIPEDPQLGVPRVGIPRPPRASMRDVYDRMCRMNIRQEAIERMEYRQSYH